MYGTRENISIHKNISIYEKRNIKTRPMYINRDTYARRVHMKIDLCDEKRLKR